MTIEEKYNLTKSPFTLYVVIGDSFLDSSRRYIVSMTPIPIQFLLSICQAANFICEFYETSDGEEADIYLDYFKLEDDNFPYSSYPYRTVTMKFGTLKPNYVEKTFQFLKVFSVNMWVTILICIILISLIVYIVFGRKVAILSSIFYMCSSFLGQYHDWRPRTIAQRILIIFLNCGIMLIALAYCSVLLSMLTMSLREKGIKTIDDLYDALKTDKGKLINYEGYDTHLALIRLRDEKMHFIAEKLKNCRKIA